MEETEAHLANTFWKMSMTVLDCSTQAKTQGTLKSVSLLCLCYEYVSCFVSRSHAHPQLTNMMLGCGSSRHLSFNMLFSLTTASSCRHIPTSEKRTKAGHSLKKTAKVCRIFTNFVFYN